MVEQVTGAAAHQLQRSLGQQPRVHDQLDQPRGQVGGLGGRLDQARQAGDERGRELLQRPPDREVERVDLHRDPAQRRQDVLARERAAPAERLDRAVYVDGVVRQLAPGLAGVAEQHPDAAVHVEPGVAERRPGPGRQLVQFGPALPEPEGDLLELGRPLMEGQRAERGSAGVAAVGQRRAHVDSRRRDAGDFLAGHRVEDGSSLDGGGYPGTAYVAA
jgi:hypothetical protein